MITDPVEDNIACSLMSQLKFGATKVPIGLADAPEHQESFLGLFEVRVVLADKRGSGILCSSFVHL